MRKILIAGAVIIFLFFGFFYYVIAAPPAAVTYHGTLLPLTDATYDLGTSTQRWRNLYISGTCTGCGGGSGTVSTSTNETPGSLAYWTSNSATPALLGKVATGTLAVPTGLT